MFPLKNLVHKWLNSGSDWAFLNVIVSQIHDKHMVLYLIGRKKSFHNIKAVITWIMHHFVTNWQPIKFLLSPLCPYRLVIPASSRMKQTVNSWPCNTRALYQNFTDNEFIFTDLKKNQEFIYTHD